MVALMTRVPSALDSRLQRESGLTHFEYRVLSLLSEEAGHRLVLSDLATRANASLSRLSHVISKLERLGWVHRTTNAGRRGVYATLTDDGYAKVVAATPGYLAAARALVLDGLTPAQVEMLAELGETLAARLDETLS
ncbi:MarR family winged helix-turn-helix transcriptional regulator [Nocardia camponoti]|nr:MarR family transcriptional regulator [Nocardia camponoti]